MQRTRAYFFDTPRTTAGAKLNSQNIPSETTFRDLLDSMIFKTESADHATNALYGSVIFATTAISKARIGAGVVIPEQLPVLEVNGAEKLTAGAYSYEGIKLTAIDGTYRLNYQIDFDPASLTIKTTPATTDYVVISDIAAAGVPKKVLVSSLLTSSYWQKVGNTISPATAGDSLDQGSGTITGAAFLLTYGASTAILPSAPIEDVGASLTVRGGAGGSAIGAAKNGGVLYLYGGAKANAGTDGDTYLCWTGAAKRGLSAIGGATEATYQLKVYGNVKITGTLTHGAYTPIISYPPNPGGYGILTPVTGDIGWYSEKATMDGLLGAALSAKSVLWFNGTAYTTLALGATGDKYLRVNSGLDLEAGDLVLTGKVLNASLGEKILWANMTALIASVVPVLNASGVVVASAVTSTELGYLSGATSNVQTQLTALGNSVTTWAKITATPTTLLAAQMKANFTADSTGGAISLTLPAISTLIANQQVRINQISANGTTLHCNAADGGFLSLTGGGVTTTVAMTDGDSMIFIADTSGASNYWRRIQ